MVYCLQAQLAFETAARRDEIVADLANFSSERWGSTYATAVSPLEPGFWLEFEVRFVRQADQQALDNRIENFRGGPPASRPQGGWVRFHSCPHDEPVVSPCSGVVTSRMFP